MPGIEPHPTLSNKEELLRLIRSGKSQSKIAEELGVSVRSVRLWERKHGINRPFVIVNNSDLSNTLSRIPRK